METAFAVCMIEYTLGYWQSDWYSRYGSIMFRVILVLSLAFLFLPVTGCTSAEYSKLLQPPFDQADPGSVLASDLWPMKAQSHSVVVTDQGQQHETTDQTTSIGSNVWRMSVNGFWIVEARAEEDGSLVILSELEQAEARRVEYDPPLPLLPAELWTGQPVRYTSEAYLYNHDSGALEATGEVVATYRLLGKKVLSPGGLLPGDAPEEAVYVVETERHYDMPLVAVQMKILSAYKPGSGPVAGRTTRTVKLFGLLPIQHVISVEQR